MLEPITYPNVSRKTPIADFDIVKTSSLLLKVSRMVLAYATYTHKDRHTGTNQNDMPYIYYTLKFTYSHANQYQAHPIVTFDQCIHKIYSSPQILPGSEVHMLQFADLLAI